MSFSEEPLVLYSKKVIVMALRHALEFCFFLLLVLINKKNTSLKQVSLDLYIVFLICTVEAKLKN